MLALLVSSLGVDPSSRPLLSSFLQLACDVFPQAPFCSNPACPVDLSPLTLNNEQGCEFYEVCISPGDGIAQSMVMSIDDTLYCGVSGVFAGCADAGLTGCHGELHTGATGQISNEKWDELCAIAQTEVFVNFGCGYWLV